MAPERRLILFVFTLLGASVAAEPPSVQTSRSTETLRSLDTFEFPAGDESISWFQQRGLLARLAPIRLAETPDRVDTLSLLIEVDRIDDALRVLRRIVETRPDQMAAAFQATASQSHKILGDASHGYPETLRAIVDAAGQPIESMPREEAARVARQLVNIEAGLARGAPGAQTWSTLLGAFVEHYAGTEEAALAEVSLIADRLSPQAIDRLDAYARAHPGTAAAAEALYLKGFHLAHNAQILGEKTGDDPTDRFFRVLDTVTELESGKYPPSEWVSKAPSLVTEFFAYKPSYASANLDRLLAAQEAFVKAHLKLDERDPQSYGVGYLITSKMGELLNLKGEGVIGVDRLLARLERTAAEPDAVRFLRTTFYQRPPEWVPSEQRDALRAKARPALASLSNAGTPFYKRKALATLAAFEFRQRHYAEALPLYTEYVRTYPRSDYAWVAALRIGQCEAAAGRLDRAIAAFRSASTEYASNPPAAVLGRVFASRAAEAANDFAQALGDARAGLSGWDDLYGAAYQFDSPRGPGPGDPFKLLDDTRVVKADLTARISQLQQASAAPGGAVLERGRWFLSRGRWDEAVTALAPILETSAPARELEHEARLGRALEMANVEKGADDIGPAVREIATLCSEPFDSATGVARIVRATLAALQRALGDADALMTEALDQWRDADRKEPTASGRGALERDAVEIRNAVFLPQGGEVYGGSHWNAFSWNEPARFLMVDPRLQVKLADGQTVEIVAYDRFPSLDNVLFLPAARRVQLERVMAALGGTKTRQPREIMETPNQPAGPSLSVLAFWKRYFAARGGHWGGWVFQTYPIVGRIEFIDAARTRAAVQVEVGYSGATVQMEKKDGVWIAKALTNFWVT